MIPNVHASASPRVFSFVEDGRLSQERHHHFLGVGAPPGPL